MTGICTDIGNILGQACRTDSNAETWRLKVHVPILISYIIGGIFGQIFYSFMREASMIIPCLFTGGIAAIYLSLPFVKNAAEVLAKQTEFGRGMGQPVVEVRYIGDPRHSLSLSAAGADKFALLSGRDLDFEIQEFSAEMDFDMDTEILKGKLNSPVGASPTEVKRNQDAQSSVVKTTAFGGQYKNVSVGGSTEMLYTAGFQ